MKTLLLISFSICLYGAASGKIITVDNNEGAGADFSSLQDAVNAAEPGDTLQIHVSHLSYKNITLNKRLTLIGPGHYPEAAAYTGATVGKIALSNGSAGSVITGLRISSIIGNPNHTTNNITIENNFFYDVAGSLISGSNGSGSSDNWVIRGNVFAHNSYCGGCRVIELKEPTGSTNDNWLISNNIIYWIGNNSFFQDVNATTLIINNTLIHTGGDENYNYGFFSKNKNQNAIVKNNIFVATDIHLDNVSINCASCVFSNNLTYNPNVMIADLPGTGNINNANPKFVNAPGFTWNYNYDFRLAEDSPAKNAGTDGGDPGAYGTDFPFSKFGYPAGVPVIESFEVNNQLVTKGEDIVIKVKAKAGSK